MSVKPASLSFLFVTRGVLVQSSVTAPDLASVTVGIPAYELHLNNYNIQYNNNSISKAPTYLA